MLREALDMLRFALMLRGTVKLRGTRGQLGDKIAAV